MLYDLFFYTLGGIINAFAWLFQSISYVFPEEFQESITFFISHLAYAKGIFPVDSLLNALELYLVFVAYFYGLKITLYIFAHTPWIGGKMFKLPSFSSKIGKN